MQKKEIVQKLQLNLKQIRQMMELSTQQLADYLGLTRQSVNNLENTKSTLSEIQVIALLAVIERRLYRDSPEFRKIKNLLGWNANFATESLLDIWFSLSDLHYKEYTPDCTEPQPPMKTIHIIHTDQLVRDSGIIPILVDRGEEIHIPSSVTKELDDILNDNILDEIMTEKIILAKRTLKTHSQKIHFWKAKNLLDSDIQQLVAEKLCDFSVSVINVYTNDPIITKD